MPKNQACPGAPRVSDPITDQEMAFALLILSGSMTDRAAAQAVRLNPDTAAYTKAKPRVRDFMVQHRAAVQQQLVDQETDQARRAAEELRRKAQWRQKVLDRLWEIAALPAEVTRGSITGQVKAISMIMSIEGLVPDRRAGSSHNQSGPPPSQPQINEDEWLRPQREQTIAPQPGPVDEEANLAEPAPGSTEDAPRPIVEPGDSTFADRPSSSAATSPAPHAPDTRVPCSIKKNPFARYR
jgi:hypothetical protein